MTVPGIRELSQPDTTLSAVPTRVVPKRVLIVDDNEDGAHLLADLLQLHGHQVEVAFEGMSALSLLDRFVPEVALLDIGLPNMDGYTLVRELKQRVQNGVFIAITGCGQKVDRDRAASAGFDRLIVKPVSTKVLIDLMREIDGR